MNYEEKFIAIQVDTNNINDEVCVSLKIGNITGPYYDREWPQDCFDTKEDAIKWAHKENEHTNWLILPFIKFKTP